MQVATRRPRICALACAALVVWGRIAGAGGPVDAEHAAAVESFRRGTQLIEGGRLQDAIDAFREALRHEPSSVGARLDLADCYEKIGAPAPAWREYTLAEVYAIKANDVRRSLAHSSAAHLEPGLLLVSWRRDPSLIVAMRVDGEAVAPEIVARGTFAVAAGSHRFELGAPNKAPLTLDITGTTGETRHLSFAFTTDASPQESSMSDTSSSSSSIGASQRTWGLVVATFGVAGVVTGTATGIVAASKKSTLDREASDPSIGAARFYDDRSTAKTFAAVSTTTFVIGAAALVTGSIVFFTAPTSRDGAARVRVRPTLGGVTVEGTF